MRSLAFTVALFALAAGAGCGAATSGARLPVASVEASTDTLRADLDALFDETRLPGGIWSVVIAHAGSGETIYTRHPRTLLMPASNMKIVTMAVAAERLGWDFRFETRLAATGPVEDGVLRGDLVVIGGGDPSIVSRDDGPAPLMREWAAMLRDAGVRRVAGRIIGDDDVFDDRGLGQGWSWDYLAYGYAAPVGGLQFNENIAVLIVTPGAEGAVPAIEAVPAGHGLTVVNRMTTGGAESAASVSVDRAPGSDIVTVSGSVPAGGAVAYRTVAVPNPTLFFARAFRGALAGAGIRVDGEAVDIDDLPSRPDAAAMRILATAGSDPLTSIGARLMKVSQNLVAETLLKTLGRSDGAPGSAARGKRVIAEVLASWGVERTGFSIADGSGLSRYNYLSADTLVKILTRMYDDPRHRAPFLATLPVGGHDGTLDERMRDNDLDRRVQAKTGTISNARALSGFLTAPSGERVVFSIIANSFQGPSSEVDAVAEAALSRVLRAMTSGTLRAPALAPH